jgi:uncharacterized OsmC-like protein
VGVAYEKDITLRRIEVDVKHKQNIAVGGPKDPNQRRLRLTELLRRIRVGGPIDERQAAELFWGADNCPVSNSIKDAIAIKTELDVVA